jgi:hypothetical protein
MSATTRSREILEKKWPGRTRATDTLAAMLFGVLALAASPAAAAIEGWENFYVIVGSSAGALIGLQFVVMTLLSEIPVSKVDSQAGGAFATPSVIHFGVVLFLSALACVPWEGIATVAAVWGAVGVGGLGYLAVVVRRLRRQRSYRPVLEDWLFHAVLPLAAYVMLVAAACTELADVRPGLFLVAGASLLLLFVGIHNAWDAVTYHIFVRRREQEEKK